MSAVLPRGTRVTVTGPDPAPRKVGTFLGASGPWHGVEMGRVRFGRVELSYPLADIRPFEPTTAATVQPGDTFEFPLIPVSFVEPIVGGRLDGWIEITYSRPFDDSGNDWRIYPPDYVPKHRA